MRKIIMLISIMVLMGCAHTHYDHEIKTTKRKEVCEHINPDADISHCNGLFSYKWQSCMLEAKGWECKYRPIVVDEEEK